MPIYKFSSFNLIEKDNCYDQFDRQLDLNKIEITSELDRRFEEIEGCGVSMKMILKGVLRKVSNTIYEHLESNNSELEVLELLDYGKVKGNKL